MCIGFPGTVVSVDATGATVEQDGRLRRASTLIVPDVHTGDQVIVAAGTILERLEPSEAAEIRRTLLEAIALDAEAARTTAPGGGLS